MAAIAAEAGITKPILYRYFGDKRGLYEALAQRHTTALLAALRAELRGPRDRRARTRALIAAYLDYVEQMPGVYRFLLYRAAEEVPAVRSQVVGFVRHLGEEIGAGLAWDLGLPADDPRARAWGTAIIGAVQAAVDRWLDERDVPPGELVDHLTELVCDGWARS